MRSGVTCSSAMRRARIRTSARRMGDFNPIISMTSLRGRSGCRVASSTACNDGAPRSGATERPAGPTGSSVSRSSSAARGTRAGDRRQLELVEVRDGRAIVSATATQAGKAIIRNATVELEQGEESASSRRRGRHRKIDSMVVPTSTCRSTVRTGADRTPGGDPAQGRRELRSDGSPWRQRRSRPIRHRGRRRRSATSWRCSRSTAARHRTLGRADADRAGHRYVVDRLLMARRASSWMRRSL